MTHRFLLRHGFLIALVAYLLIGLTLLAQPQGTEETAAQAAEQAGKLREAFAHYVAALQQVMPGTDADQHLREKIISLAGKLTPTPAISDEARSHMTKGRTAVQNAKDTEGLRGAITEFQEASKLAPWVGNIYFNLGAIDEKAGLYPEAIRNFKFYLLASPSSLDSDRIRTRIADMQAKLEQQRQEEARKRDEAERAARLREAQQKADYLRSLLGGLRLDNIYICLPATERMRPGRMSGWGCTESELGGPHWSEAPYQMKVFAIKAGPPKVELVGSGQDFFHVSVGLAHFCFSVSDYRVGQTEFRTGIWDSNCDDRRVPYTKVDLKADWNGSPAIYFEYCTEGTNCTEKTAQYLAFSR